MALSACELALGRWAPLGQFLELCPNPWQVQHRRWSVGPWPTLVWGMLIGHVVHHNWGISSADCWLYLVASVVSDEVPLPVVPLVVVLLGLHPAVLHGA